MRLLCLYNCSGMLLERIAANHFYDEAILIEAYRELIRNKIAKKIECIQITKTKEIVNKRKMLHCLCCTSSSDEMIQCDFCKYWFYLDKCINQPASQKTLEGMPWIGPCCDKPKSCASSILFLYQKPHNNQL